MNYMWRTLGDTNFQNNTFQKFHTTQKSSRILNNYDSFEKKRGQFIYEVPYYVERRILLQVKHPPHHTQKKNLLIYLS